MITFQWEIIDCTLKKVQGIFQTIMLEPLLFFKKMVPETKKENVADIIS